MDEPQVLTTRTPVASTVRRLVALTWVVSNLFVAGAAADENSTGLFYLHSNGVTVLCPDAAVGSSGIVNGITYTKRNESEVTRMANVGRFYPESWKQLAKTCTSGISNLNGLFAGSRFNEDISSWFRAIRALGPWGVKSSTLLLKSRAPEGQRSFPLFFYNVFELCLYPTLDNRTTVF